MSTFALSALTISLVAAMMLFVGCAANSSNDRIGMAAVNSDYICPLTGEELPCPDCCPLNQEQAEQQVAKNDAKAASDGEGYECPLTGEILPCPKCCPLNN